MGPTCPFRGRTKTRSLIEAPPEWMLEQHMPFRAIFWSFSTILLCSAVACAQQEPSDTPNATTSPADQAAAGTTPGSTSPLPPGATPQPVSEADQISRLKRALEADNEQLEALRKKLDDPDSEYHQAEVEYNQVEKDREALLKKIDELGIEENAEAKLKEAEEQLKTLEKSRALTKERFELLIEERKVNKEGLTTLQSKIDQEKQALARLMGETPAPAPPPLPPTLPLPPPRPRLPRQPPPPPPQPPTRRPWSPLQPSPRPRPCHHLS